MLRPKISCVMTQLVACKQQLYLAQNTSLSIRIKVIKTNNFSQSNVKLRLHALLMIVLLRTIRVDKDFLISICKWFNGSWSRHFRLCIINTPSSAYVGVTKTKPNHLHFVSRFKAVILTNLFEILYILGKLPGESEHLILIFTSCFSHAQNSFELSQDIILW